MVKFGLEESVRHVVGLVIFVAVIAFSKQYTSYTFNG